MESESLAPDLHSYSFGVPLGQNLRGSVALSTKGLRASVTYSIVAKIEPSKTAKIKPLQASKDFVLKVDKAGTNEVVATEATATAYDCCCWKIQMGMRISLEKDQFSQDEIIKAKVTIDNSKSEYSISRVRFKLNMVITVQAESGSKTKFVTLLDLNYPEISAHSKLINKPYFIDLKTCQAYYCSDIPEGGVPLSSLLRTKLPPTYRSPWMLIEYFVVLKPIYPKDVYFEPIFLG